MRTTMDGEEVRLREQLEAVEVLKGAGQALTPCVGPHARERDVQGEVLEDDGLRFEILESTDRRVERLRISTRQPSEPQQINLL